MALSEPLHPARGTAPAAYCHPRARPFIGGREVGPSWKPLAELCGRFVLRDTCTVVESHARAVADFALANLKAHLCPHLDQPRPILPLASPMPPHLCVEPKGAPQRPLARPRPRPLLAPGSKVEAEAEAEASHAAIDSPEGYWEGGSRVGFLESGEGTLGQGASGDDQAVASLVRAQMAPLCSLLAEVRRLGKALQRGTSSSFPPEQTQVNGSFP